MLYNPPTGGAANDPYVGKNIAAGIQGSKIPPGAAEFPQRELVNLITASGQSPTNSDLQQVLRAVRSGVLEFYADTGAVNAPSIAPQPAHTSLADGLFIVVEMANSPTGPAVQHVNGLSAPIVRRNGLPLAGGDWVVGERVPMRYCADKNAFEIAGLTTSDVLALILANPTILTEAINSIQAANPLPGIVNVTNQPGYYTLSIFGGLYAIEEGFITVTVTQGYVDFTLPEAFSPDANFTVLCQDVNGGGSVNGGPGIEITGSATSGGTVRIYPRIPSTGAAYTGSLSLKFIAAGHTH